ncbi:class I SAM-dependent methyltransferase [Actinopolymorpha sp. B9G3]|uniref:class I SAM-dependent methyltransferase n=1 Tax=Actinopolymorpha sp. B9G3 TaxID=3158970 RepID=UPI0032D94E9F
MTDVEMNRALTFGQVADEYDRWRASYPDAAVDWLAPSSPARVADVGAGTGKLTSLLLARGLTVEAVEPDPRMLAVLARNNPDAGLHQCDSTSIPVEDGSLDAVLAADAWHWFDVEATIIELRRVLKPGAWLGLVWNPVLPPIEPWELDLAGLNPYKINRDKKPSTDTDRPFPEDELEFARFAWEWKLTPEHFAAKLATNSAVIAMSPQERQEHLTAVRSLLQQHCDATGIPALPFRFEASCTRWTPKPSHTQI